MQGDHILAQIAPVTGAILVAVDDIGDVADGDPADPARPVILFPHEHDRLGLLHGANFALGADKVTPLAFFHLAGRQRGAGVPHPAKHVGDGQPVKGKLLGVHHDAQFAPRSPSETGARHPGDALDLVDDDVFDEVAIGLHIAGVARLAPKHKIGDGDILRTAGIHPRFVGFPGKVVDTRQPVVDEQHALVEVVADLELEPDPRLTEARTAGEFDHALDTAELLLETVGHFPFDVDRRLAPPIGAKVDHRPAYIGGELNGNGLQRHQPESDDHQHPGHHRHGSPEGNFDQLIQLEAPLMRTRLPSLRRSFPRVTTSSPSLSPESTSKRPPIPSPISI